jgi:hypothetical protein
MASEFGPGPNWYTWKEEEYSEVLTACQAFNLHLPMTFNLQADLEPQVYHMFVTLNNFLYTNDISVPVKATGSSSALQFAQSLQTDGYITANNFERVPFGLLYTNPKTKSRPIPAHNTSHWLSTQPPFLASFIEKMFPLRPGQPQGQKLIQWQAHARCPSDPNREIRLLCEFLCMVVRLQLGDTVLIFA